MITALVDIRQIQQHLIMAFVKIPVLITLIIIGCITQDISSLDWLVDQITTPVSVTKTNSGLLRLQNGLIKRDFLVTPNFVTVDFYSFEKEQSLLRALDSESTILLDGILYNIGGMKCDIPRAYLNRSALSTCVNDDNAFQYVGYKLMNPVVPFPYTPKRGAPKDIHWPPKGLRMDVEFKAPALAPVKHKDVSVIVHYEMYVGIPVLSKWISVHASSYETQDINVTVLSVEYLSLNQQWGNSVVANFENGWLFIETDQSHGTSVSWGVDPASILMPGSFEPAVNCSYEPIVTIQLGSDGLESFKVHELVIGSSDRERASLARHRMVRILAPHTQENPIFFHMVNSSSDAVRSLIDQMAEVGFEMMIYSFGSGFNIESTDKAYIQQMASDIAYAKAKGIEVGGYDLIALTRSVKPEWMAINAQNKSIGDACFASGWYDDLLTKMLLFMDQTGLSMVETDGPYGGYACSSTEHKHHKNADDSIYIQQKLQGKFFSILRTKEVYINQPDYFFYQGGSRTGLGYNENQYSLPRWQDISISRQSVYDDTYTLTPTQGWMFAPLVDYHAGGDAAMLEPLTLHKTAYEWSLAQYLGAGTAACYRGYRLYDSNVTKALVKKWVDFYKSYRDILISDVIHVRRPDMQSIDSYMHVNPYIENKALAMVFNPTSETITQNLTFPLYYSGLNDKAMVYEQGGSGKMFTLDRQYNIKIQVTLEPLNITWFLFK